MSEEELVERVAQIQKEIATIIRDNFMKGERTTGQLARISSEAIIKYLASQGLCLEVEGELPKNPFPELARGWFGSDVEANIIYYSKQEGYKQAQKDMAGYIKVVRLKDVLL